MRSCISPNKCIVLRLDEGPDLGLIAHGAAIEVDQIRLEDLHSVALDNVGRNWHEDRLFGSSLRTGRAGGSSVPARPKNGTNRTIQQNEVGINCRSNLAIRRATDTRLCRGMSHSEAAF